MQQRHSTKDLLEAAKVAEATIDVTNEPSMSADIVLFPNYYAYIFVYYYLPLLWR